MLSVREMARAIKNIHSRIVGVPCNEIEQRITLIDCRGRVIVRPGEQCGFAQATVANDAEGFIFLPREILAFRSYRTYVAFETCSNIDDNVRRQQ